MGCTRNQHGMHVECWHGRKCWHSFEACTYFGELAVYGVCNSLDDNGNTFCCAVYMCICIDVVVDSTCCCRGLDKPHDVFAECKHVIQQ